MMPLVSHDADADVGYVLAPLLLVMMMLVSHGDDACCW